VYVTGAIAPADRPVVLRHLASCERCRDELAGLAGLPGLLRRPSVQAAAEAPGAAAEATSGAGHRGADRLARLSRLLSGTALWRRRHRWVLPPLVTTMIMKDSIRRKVLNPSSKSNLPRRGLVMSDG
jgi:anti-sigma factor RsiW